MRAGNAVGRAYDRLLDGRRISWLRAAIAIGTTMTVCRKALSIIHTAGRVVSSPARRWCVGGAAFAVLAGLFVSHADLTRMSRSFLRADWHWLAVALGLMLVSLLLRSVALKVIVDALGCVRTRLSETFSATSIGLLATPSSRFASERCSRRTRCTYCCVGEGPPYPLRRRSAWP